MWVLIYRHTKINNLHPSIPLKTPKSLHNTGSFHCFYSLWVEVFPPAALSFGPLSLQDCQGFSKLIFLRLPQGYI